MLNYYCYNSNNILGHKILNNASRVRAVKSQGSCKMKNKCTSQIILTEKNDQFLTHYGHNISLEHIRVPKIDRMDIGAKFISGNSVNRQVQKLYYFI